MDDEEYLELFQTDIVEGIVDLLIVQSDVSDFSIEPSGNPLVMAALTTMTQSEENWLHVVGWSIRKVPKFALNVIRDVIRDMPCPTVDTVHRLLGDLLKLSPRRATNPSDNRQAERNICVVLTCLANKLAGRASTQIFTRNVCDYLFEFFLMRRKSRQLLMALLTLEKFAVVHETKTIIVKKFSQLERNPLFDLLEYDKSEENYPRQIGFCARWALDNVFPVTRRQPSYLTVDMSRINVIFNQNTQKFMKISPDGLELRCDTEDFGSLRATCGVTHGTYYFEVLLITGGPMRIGLVTSLSPMTDTYAIGKDDTSFGYDGSTRCLWNKGVSRDLFGIHTWQPGYVIGFLVNTVKKRIYFVQNKSTVIVSLPEFFSNPQGNKKYYPAVTMAPYVQCRFNFGSEPFCYRSPERGPYSTFNEVGSLTPEEKMVKPRNEFQSENSVYNEDANACEICYDNNANSKLLPCGHDTFCRECTSKCKACPICRDAITERV
ncbi:PREDICTED: RING finger and SPRY domain-containing protein 1-like [Papilio xuthus]|uniref:RING finger and SPRY domain-containing protein 1 n=1 Tax=Papilio xuthus TaxID=66420 RepID=A0A194PF45_PAPXU|nr:PREDICTED: RING finger and SPRY domain-containing protein 1-like [Papilio xuthus]XP_013179591.1 PREDICTED: RING finger and SPRY domain-containing protein 1-like [Papilio xuthus]KPI91902.1 RING finger and SPRY domain-containing protein 1 [Papilio xuthus]